MDVNKHLQIAKELSPDFVDAFEDFIPKWLNRFLPFYKEAKEKNVELFELVGMIDMGAPATIYEKDGVGYYLHDVCGIGPVLALDANYPGNKEVNWHSCFSHEYPEVESDTLKRLSNFGVYNMYLTRIFNQKPPYDGIEKAVDACFKSITGDPDVFFSISTTSCFYFTDRARSYVNHCMGLD